MRSSTVSTDTNILKIIARFQYVGRNIPLMTLYLSSIQTVNLDTLKKVHLKLKKKKKKKNENVL